jgi:enoyl-CoA hydratase/carnithine racemase
VVAPEQLESEALGAAAQLAKLSRPAYQGTKRKLRGELLTRVRATLTQDMAGW